MSASADARPDPRRLGLLGATGVGVGAIVGGGILALAGVALATSGPAAVVAFAANGAIAALTAVSFARLASAFPESGGTYPTRRRSCRSRSPSRSAGWSGSRRSSRRCCTHSGSRSSRSRRCRGSSAGYALDLAWLGSRPFRVTLALAATGGYAIALVRRAPGGGAVGDRRQGRSSSRC